VKKFKNKPCRGEIFENTLQKVMFKRFKNILPDTNDYFLANLFIPALSEERKLKLFWCKVIPLCPEGASHYVSS